LSIEEVHDFTMEKFYMQELIVTYSQLF